MPRVFISYRRSDSSTISGRIYDHLARVFNESNVFKDVYDIPAGSDFRKVIEDNINACHAQLIIIGPTWLETKAADGSRRLDDAEDAVRIEVETGLNCQDILVIPVLVSGAHMPHADQLPESIKNLSFRNAIVIRDDPDFRGDIGNLLRVLRQLDERQNTSRWRRRMPYIGVLALAAVVIVVGVLIAIANNSGTRFDLIMSNGTETRIFSLALTSPVNIRGTPTALTGTPAPITAGVSATPEASATPAQSGAASATPSPAGGQVSATPSPAVAAATDIFPPTPDEAGAIVQIRQGDALQEQGDYPAALDRYTQAIALDPNNSEGYISRASVYATLGTNFDQAVEDAKTAIRIDPGNYWNYDELGKIYFAAQSYDLSVQAYTKALSIDANPSGYLGRGSAYHRLGDSTHALEDLSKAITLDPSNTDVYMERGWTNFDAKHYTDAIVDFTTVIEQNDQTSDAYVGRGDAYRDSGNPTKAIEDFTAALAIDPDSATIYYERGYTHQLIGDNDEARDDFLAALKRDAYYTNAYVQLARLELDKLSDPDAALQYAQQAVDLGDSNPAAELMLGDVYYAQGKAANALVHYRRYVELIGNDADPAILTRIQELEAP